MERLNSPHAIMQSWQWQIQRPGQAVGALRFKETVWGIEVFVEEISQDNPVLFIDLFHTAHNEGWINLVVDDPQTGDPALRLERYADQAHPVMVVSLALNFEQTLLPTTFTLHESKATT